CGLGPPIRTCPAGARTSPAAPGARPPRPAARVALSPARRSLDIQRNQRFHGRNASRPPVREHPPRGGGREAIPANLRLVRAQPRAFDTTPSRARKIVGTTVFARPRILSPLAHGFCLRSGTDSRGRVARYSAAANSVRAITPRP